MRQNVLDTQGVRSNEIVRAGASPTAAGPATSPTTAGVVSAALPAPDLVRVPADTAWWSGERRASTYQRPFDAQYWACWVFAVVYPLLLAYLWLTR
jgi:hypothetical protein